MNVIGTRTDRECIERMRARSQGRVVRCCDTAREGTGSGPNLEIIGECGIGGVRGSFLPVEAIRLPSPAGEQPLELRGTRTRHTPRQWYFVAIHFRLYS